MKRLNVFLFLCLICSSGLWLSSYSRLPYVAISGGSIHAYRGEIWICYLNSNNWLKTRFIGFLEPFEDASVFYPWLIDLVASDPQGRSLSRVPIWMPVAAIVLFLAVANSAMMVRRKARYAHGICLNCGYNLYGLPTLRCPECGTYTVSAEADMKRE